MHIHRRSLHWTTTIAVLLAGCSGATSIAPAAPGSDAAAPDAALSDGAVDATSTDIPACDAPLVESVVLESALLGKAPGDGSKVWIIRAGKGETQLAIVVRENAGGRSGAQTGVFGAEQLAQLTAPVALHVQTECARHGDHFDCGPSYVPTAGSWAFTKLEDRVGGAFEVELSAELVMAKMRSGKATPIAGAAGACFRSVRITGTLEAP